MEHEVRFLLPKQVLESPDIVIMVKDVKRKEFFGRLLVSKGGIEWRPKNAKRGKKWSWSRLGRKMENR